MTEHTEDDTATPTRPPQVRLRLLVAHEVRQVLRDGRFWWTGALVALLLLTSGLFGWRHTQAVQAERAEAQQLAAAQWAQQGAKNPHAAAHYGVYVFKPSGALAFLDPGVEASLGVSVKLQAHKRSALEGAAAQDASAVASFGHLSPAAIFQWIVPLLIIGLGFTAWTAERERGTLRQVMSYGVAPRRLLLGKLLGLGAALSVLALPALALGLVGVARVPSPDAAARGAALALAYGLYMAAYALGAVWVSARAESSRAALVVLLGFWGATSLLVPRLAGDLIERAAPMPSAAEFSAALKKSMDEGLPGGPKREERTEALLGEILKREGFDGGLLMMQGSLLEGYELEAEDRFEQEVLDAHFSQLQAQSDRQEQLLQAVGLISPFVAVRALSMSLAGTDLAHHQRFADAAEAHRRALVAQLNRDLGQNGGDDAWAYKANKALWERAPKFDYAPPGLGWALRRQTVSLGALALWCLIALAGLWRSARDLRRV